MAASVSPWKRSTPGDGEIIERQRQVGEVAEEAEPGAAPVHPGAEVPVERRLDLGRDPVAEQGGDEREDNKE